MRGAKETDKIVEGVGKSLKEGDEVLRGAKKSRKADSLVGDTGKVDDLSDSSGFGD